MDGDQQVNDMEQKLRPKREEDDFRYTRVGYIPREEVTDTLVAQVLKVLPGEGTLPLHWQWKNLESFKKRHPGVLLWSKTASYHMLMVSGSHTCRVWTNAKHLCVIDVLPAVAAVSAAKGLVVSKIPENCLVKCKPMVDRVAVETPTEMETFIDVLISTHGLQDWAVL